MMLLQRCDQAQQRYAEKTAFVQTDQSQQALSSHQKAVCQQEPGSEQKLSYQQVAEQSEAMAVFLELRLGLAREARVAIALPNNIAYPVCVFGSWRSGAVVVNCNPHYTLNELCYQLNDAQAEVLVIDASEQTKARALLAQTSLRAVIYVDASGGDSLASLFDNEYRLDHVLLAAQRLKSESGVQSRYLSNPSELSDIALLQYTGGTTGVSKGAVISHSNLAANVRQLEQVLGKDLLEHNESKGETILTVLPLYHIFAFTFNFLLYYVNGATNLLVANPRPLSSLEPVFAQHPITIFTAVNVLLAGLTHEAWFCERPPATLKLTIAGGTALHPAIAQRWVQLVDTPVCEGYGLTEASPVVCINPPRGPIKVGSIGKPLPETTVCIVDDKGESVEQGALGEIVVQGPQVVSGYWQQAEETAKSFIDGRLHTGDVGYMDSDGYVFIVDRKKDMIDVNGFNVYPNEVESAIAEHPGVAEVAVIGVPSPSMGERVKACVVPRQNGLSELDIIDHCKARLTPYKRPKLVEFFQQLPKSPVGKILRRELRDMALNESSETCA